MVRVAASVVTYRPNHECLSALITSLLSQVDRVFVIDNFSSDTPRSNPFAQNQQIELVHLDANVGVARAHNIGLKMAWEMGFTHIVLFDQDSLPSADMIEKLIAVEKQITSLGGAIGAIGPCYFDPRHDAPAPFIRLEGLKIRKLRCAPTEKFVAVDYLITSGTLINLKTIQIVGGMDDDLFIDYVDIDWCLRAKSMGYQSYGVCAAGMCHSLGDEVVSWGGRTISVRTPLRNYYLFRNAFLLYKRPYISWVWIANDAVRLLLKLGFFTLITPPRFQNLVMMFRGMWDGLLGRSGPFRV